MQNSEDINAIPLKLCTGMHVDRIYRRLAVRRGAKSPQTFIKLIYSENNIVAVFYYNISISLLSFKPISGTESSLNIKQIFKCE